AARGPNADEKIEIPLGDFATRFDGGEERRAEAMAEALNALRQFCGHAAAGQAFLVPAGLAVAPMPKARALPGV
ncbi:hypothetical protein WFJ45_23630, partial [Salmonella enterica subsp. enterica serovar Minnesota]|uniref:hypothetical protein n=1 Tax=Salmonella enterica TaxID=28901 RepID=UPI003D29754C